MEKNMTYNQLKKIRETLDKLEKMKKSPNARDIYLLNENLLCFLGAEYIKPSLTVENNTSHSNDLTVEDILADIDKIKSTLEGLIAQNSNYTLANDIIDLIYEGKSVGKKYDLQQKFIANIYYHYRNFIELDSSLVEVARESIKRRGIFDLNLDNKTTIIDRVVIDGLIGQLEQVVEFILQSQEPVVFSRNKDQTTVINNVISNNINIDICIENAINQIKRACLPDQQEKETLDKIEEIKKISGLNEDTKWEKIKNVLKWLTEKGIKVASIIVPLLGNIIK